MSAALLVLPDFLIIIFGWLLNQKLGFSREFFVSLEKLTDCVSCPALLFQSIVRVSGLARNESIGASQFIDIHRHTAFSTDTVHLVAAHLLDQYDALHTHS